MFLSRSAGKGVVVSEPPRWEANYEKRPDSADQVVRRFYPSTLDFQDFQLDGQVHISGHHELMFRYLWDDDEGTVLLERFTEKGASEVNSLRTGFSSALSGYLFVEDHFSEMDWDSEVRRFHGGGDEK
jgi:hypothetical protein